MWQVCDMHGSMDGRAKRGEIKLGRGKAQTETVALMSDVGLENGQ